MDRRRSALLIPEIYQATIDSSHWDKVLELLATLTGSTSACLYYQDKDFNTANTIAKFGCPCDFFLDCNAHFSKLDSLFDKAACNDAKKETLCQLFNLGDNNFVDLNSEIYEEWLKPKGIFHLGRIQFIDNSKRKAALAILRDEQAGAWGDGDIRVIRAIIPHLKRALDIHGEFTRLRLQQDALLKGLDRLVIGLILYDRHARTVYINPTARAIIKTHPAMELKDQQLVLNIAHDNNNLHNTILHTATIEPEDSWKQSVSIGVKHPDSETPLPLLITPMHAHMLTTELEYESARVAVFMSDPNLQQPISVDNLVSVYDLTPSEAQVAISIANGHSIDNIAKTSHHSAHTIRSQLKSTFRKVGVSRQSDLIKLLLTGPFAHRRHNVIL